jgi:peptidoglycan hydrolase-like protein with peptidoglycan-binding domain
MSAAKRLDVAGFGGQVDDAEAILTYMKGTNAQTDAAATLKAQFLTWYNNSSWYNKNFDSKWYDELRSRRNAFNIANSVTPKEKAAIQNVLERGMTAEEMQGKPRPAIDTKTGLVGQSIKKPPVGMPIPNATGGTGFTRNLKKGVTPGADIKRWQGFLGINPPTGYFDAITDTKTRAYQKANGLVSDGIVGAKTWAAAFPIVKAEAPAPNAPPSFVTSAMKVPSGSSGSKPAAAKPAAQPASKPAAKPASTGTPAATTPASLPVAQAGMLGGLSSIKSWPLWAKVAGGLAAVGIGTAAVGAVAFSEHSKIRRS